MTQTQRRILLATALFLLQRAAEANAQSGGVGAGAGGGAQSGAPSLGLGDSGGLDTNSGSVGTPDEYDKMGKEQKHAPDSQPTWPIPQKGHGSMPGNDPRVSPNRNADHSIPDRAADGASDAQAH